MTLMFGFSVLRKSYVVASRRSYAGAARSTAGFFTYLTRFFTSLPLTRTFFVLKP